MNKFLTGQQVVTEYSLQPFQLAQCVFLGKLIPLNPNTGDVVVPPWFQEFYDYLRYQDMEALRLRLDFLEWWQRRQESRAGDQGKKWEILRQRQLHKNCIRRNSHRTSAAEWRSTRTLVRADLLLSACYHGPTVVAILGPKRTPDPSRDGSSRVNESDERKREVTAVGQEAEALYNAILKGLHGRGMQITTATQEVLYETFQEEFPYLKKHFLHLREDDFSLADFALEEGKPRQDFIGGLLQAKVKGAFVNKKSAYKQYRESKPKR